MPEPQKLVARLAKQLSGITNPKARASVYWLVGQFASDDRPPMHGIGWEGVAPWVPDVLRNGVKGFVNEVRDFADTVGKPIVFTRYNGRSTDV